MLKKLKTWVEKLEHYADRSWYGPLIGLLAALDQLVIVIPNDGILIASTILVPKRWTLFAICISVGSTLGAIAVFFLIETQGLPWFLQFYPGIDQTDIWKWTAQFFTDYGLLVVFVVGASPIIQHPAIILAALGGTSATQFAVTLFLGRILKYLFLAYVASHSPKLLKRLWGIKGELKDAGVKID